MAALRDALHEWARAVARALENGRRPASGAPRLDVRRWRRVDPASPRSRDRSGQCRASAPAYRLPARSQSGSTVDQPCARRFLAVRAGRGPTRRRSQILGQRPRRKNVWLYKPGAPGRDLGALGSLRSRCDPRRCSRTPPRSSAGWRGDFPVIPVPQGCRPVSRSIETKANAASASEKYTVLVTTSVTTSISGHDCLLRIPSAMTAPCAYGERGDRMRVDPRIIFFHVTWW